MSSNNEQEIPKSGGQASLPLRKRKTMDNFRGKKSSKPAGKLSSATSSKGRGRGGGKPSRGGNYDDGDSKDPIVDKKFFDGFVDDFDVSDLS